MKISKGWTVPGTEAYTSKRGDVEVDETDLSRLLAEHSVNLNLSLSVKDVYTLLDTEADKYVTLQQVGIGAMPADEGKDVLANVKRLQSNVLAKYKND